MRANASGPAVVSPDGRRIAFSARVAGGKLQLFVRSLDSLSAHALAGTEGATLPFWSPESQFIGFFANGMLKKIDASGGPAIRICDAPQGRGGAWSADGVIVFTPNVDALHRVAASGGGVS